MKTLRMMLAILWESLRHPKRWAWIDWETFRAYTADEEPRPKFSTLMEPFGQWKTVRYSCGCTTTGDNIFDTCPVCGTPVEEEL